MATNLAIDDELLASAVDIGGLKTKKETVNVALEEFIKRRQRKDAIDLFGNIDFSKNWNPQKARGKKWKRLKAENIVQGKNHYEWSKVSNTNRSMFHSSFSGIGH